jgi:hypothetical protein
VLHGELPCDPGKALGRSIGLEKRRRDELDGGGPAAAAGTQVPAKVWLGLINKRLREILWCTRKSLGTWVSENGDWQEVHTGGANGGRRRLGGECACAREATGAGLYGRWRSVKRSWGQPRRRCTRGVGSKALQREAERWPMACGGWHAGEWKLATWRRPNARGRYPQWHSSAAHGPLGPPVPRRARAARVRPLAWHGCATSRVGALWRSRAKTVCLGCFQKLLFSRFSH